MHMVLPLKLPALGFGRFHKLVQPMLIRHERRLHHGGPASGVAGPSEHRSGCGAVDVVFPSVQTVFFQEGDRYMPMDPSF